MRLRHSVRMMVVAGLASGLVALALSCQRKEQASPGTQAADSIRTLQLQRGQQAYLTYCAMCHGESGAGDGPLAGQLREQGLSAPARLDNRARLVQIGHDEVKAVIARGGGHTGRSNLMPPWGERLSHAVIDTITDFVMALPDLAPGTPASTLEKYLEAPAGSSEEGRRLFVFYCTICHGPYGRGDGALSDTLRVRNNIRPRNLTDSEYFKDKSDQDLYITIALGGGHAGKSVFMPAWTVTLQPEQIKSLVAYVRAISGTMPRP